VDTPLPDGDVWIGRCQNSRIPVDSEPVVMNYFTLADDRAIANGHLPSTVEIAITHTVGRLEILCINRYMQDGKNMNKLIISISYYPSFRNSGGSVPSQEH
jgi:hypothetical protein